MLQTMLQTVAALKPQLQQWRRWLHQHPELSFEEYETARFIRSVLDEHSITYTTAIETATLAIIGPSDNVQLALRADIDALPISEATGLPFASRRPGIMHACGHDAHTAMLLAAAVALKQHESFLPYGVICIFQPGEEKLPGGAKRLIDDGLFDEFPIKKIFGQHLNPELPAGTFGFCPGFFMAATDELFWNLSAPGSHAAQPHRSADLITTAASLILQLQTLISRMRDPLEPSVLSITTIHAGSATNILPDTLQMSGTLRTFSPKWRQKAKEHIERISSALATAAGATLSLQINEGYPALWNDPETTETVSSLARQLFSDEQVVSIQPKLWAEDFAYYTQYAAGCFWTLGVRPKEATEAAGLHTPDFNPSESAFLYGAQLLAAIPWAVRDAAHSAHSPP